MFNDEENRYVEKWGTLQKSLQFYRQVITACGGVIATLLVALMFSNSGTPLVVEKKDSVFIPLSVQSEGVVPTEESVGELVTEFIKLRYEWENFNPEQIIKSLEPLTTEGLRSKLLQEFGKKSHQNKEGSTIEQVVARVRPDVSEKAVLATFDRILRVNGVPIAVPTEISLSLVEGPKTAVNPIGLYVNGVVEHERQ